MLARPLSGPQVIARPSLEIVAASPQKDPLDALFADLFEDWADMPPARPYTYDVPQGWDEAQNGDFEVSKESDYYPAPYYGEE